MRKNVFLFMFITVFVSNLTLGQSIQDIMNNESLNYFEKVEQIEQNSGSLKVGVDYSVLKRYKRWRSFWDTRTGIDGSETAYANAWHSIFNSASLPVGGTGTVWEFVGPIEHDDMKRQMGHVACLTSDPNNQNIIYAGATTGGLWKTTNPTAAYPHWECLTDDYAGMGVTDVVVHPNNSNTIYIVTGIHFNGMMKMTGDYSLGAYKSTDGGSIWNLMMNLSPEDNIYLRKIVLDPNNSNIMYILSTTTVYKSYDGGNTWDDTNVNPGDVGFRSIVINPNNTNEIYISGNDAIYKTINAGGTWFKITSLGHPVKSNINIAWHPIENCIYALYENSGSWSGTLKKSINDGLTWSTTNTVEYVMRYVNALEISPNGNIYAGGINIYKSINSGSSFSYQSSMHADIRGFLFPNGVNDNLAYIATDGGVVRNTTGGNNAWVSCNGDLCVSQFYDIAITEQDPNLLLGGTHDCGNLRRKENGVWELVQICDGGTSKINPNNKNIQFATAGARLNRSVDGGSFNEYTGVEFMDMDGAFAFHPSDPNIIFTTNGRAELLKSTNGGAPGSFTSIKTTGGIIFAIEVNEFNPNYIYFSRFDWWQTTSYSELFSSTDGGIIWDAYGFPDAKSPIRDIVTHPADPDKIWLAFGGLNEEYKVMYSDNGGDSWTNKSSGLPNMPVNKMLYDDVNERIIIATDIGVYYRNDVGIRWYRLGSGLPNMIVTDLELNRVTGDLYIGTFGRGIWKLHMEEYCYYYGDPTISGLTTVCSSGNLTYTVQNFPGDTITWTNSSNLSYVSGQGTSSYTVSPIENTTYPNDWVRVVISNGSCDDITIQKDIYLSVNMSELEITVPIEPINGNYDALIWASGLPSDITNYDWTVTDGYIVSEEGNSITIGTNSCIKNRPKPILVNVTANNSCDYSYASKSIAVVCDGLVNPLSVNPNPANDYMEIFLENLDEGEYLGSEKLHIKLYNSRSIQVYNGVTQQKKFLINTSSYPEGLYYLHVQYKDQKYSTIIIISH